MVKKKKGGNVNKSGTANSTVEEYMEIFAWSYKKQKKNYDRIVSLQQSYDNTVLDSVWPTTSKVPIASFFEAVEKALPQTLDSMFLNFRTQLMPMELGVKMEQVHKSELALYNLITYKMRLQRACIPTIKDTCKCGVGFGIIEPISISPPSSFQLKVKNGEEEVTTRVMEVGQPVQTLRYRYLVPSQICVTPDGSDFNGDNPVSNSFFFDSYNENQFLDMYKDSVLDGEKPELLGDKNAIVEEARDSGFTSQTTIETLIKQMGGVSPKDIKPDNEKIPGRIPVLKCYDRYRRRHLWIANGKTIIYDMSDEFQTMRCPLIKASAWMDGVRFYPMSTPEAFQHLGWTKNILINMFLDILTLKLKRPIVYNSEFFDSEPTFGPEDKIRTSAPDARMGAAFMEGPDVDQSALTFYEYVNNLGHTLTGQKDFMEKNFTRGGGMAFQELVNSMEGMERLKSAVIEMTFLESVINQSMIYLQTSTGKDGVVVRERKRNKATHKEEISETTVTEDDLCHGYELAIDLGGKRRRGALEQNMSLGIYDRKNASPFFDKYEVAADHLCGSDEEIRRQLKSREEVAEIDSRQQAQREEAEATQVALGKGKIAKQEESIAQPEGGTVPEAIGETSI